MTDTVDRVMREVWEWKAAAEDATHGMPASKLIEFYTKEANEAQRRLGVDLPTRAPSEVARPRKRIR